MLLLTLDRRQSDIRGRLGTIWSRDSQRRSRSRFRLIRNAVFKCSINLNVFIEML
jgi:hypothetical protein